MSTYVEEFGKRIAVARNNLDMTMAELGELLGLHESTVQIYEKGKISKVDIEKAKEFAKALKVSPVWLLGWEEATEYKNSINSTSKVSRPLLFPRLQLLPFFLLGNFLPHSQSSYTYHQEYQNTIHHDKL